MLKQLEIEDNFVPCPAVEGDELYPNGIFVFNITKMIEYIQDNLDSVILEDVAVSDFYSSFSSINEAHLDSVDVTKPVILAEVSPGRYNLIDGNHRMEKARRIGLKHIPAYKLDVTQHIRFLTSTESYFSYVEYWNNKLEDG